MAVTKFQKELVKLFEECINYIEPTDTVVSDDSLSREDKLILINKIEIIRDIVLSMSITSRYPDSINYIDTIAKLNNTSINIKFFDLKRDTENK